MIDKLNVNERIKKIEKETFLTSKKNIKNMIAI